MCQQNRTRRPYPQHIPWPCTDVSASQRSRTLRRQTGSLRRWGCPSLRRPAGSGSSGSDSACWSSSWQNADVSPCGAPGRRRWREGETEEPRVKTEEGGGAKMTYGGKTAGWDCGEKIMECAVWEDLKIGRIFHLLLNMNFILRWILRLKNLCHKMSSPKLVTFEFFNPELNFWSLPQKYPLFFLHGQITGE